MRRRLTTAFCTLSSLVAAACAVLLMASLFVTPVVAPTLVIGEEELASDRYFLNVAWCGSLVNLQIRYRAEWEKLDPLRATMPRGARRIPRGRDRYRFLGLSVWHAQSTQFKYEVRWIGGLPEDIAVAETPRTRLQIWIPLWIPIMIFATPAGIAAVIRRFGRRRYRRKHNLCMQCGYNLIGNVSGVCPECGRPTCDKG